MAKATRDAYGEALQELGAVNKDVVVLDADLSGSTKTSVFKKAFPERHFNVGIAEQDLIGVSAGLAASGKIPFASSFAVFATGRCFEQIRNSVCYPQLNVKVAATHAGITVGEDGATHQSTEDVAVMRALPHMSVIVPADAAETKAVIRWAAEYKGPVYIRLGRSKVPEIFDASYTFSYGKGVILREGAQVTIMAMGVMVEKALKAAELLAAEGIEATVVNMSTVKPIDAALIQKEAAKTGAIVTCEEHNIIGGLGSAVAEVLAEQCPTPLERVGLKDVFGESGTPDALMEKYGLTEGNIAAAAKRVISRK